MGPSLNTQLEVMLVDKKKSSPVKHERGGYGAHSPPLLNIQHSQHSSDLLHPHAHHSRGNRTLRSVRSVSVQSHELFEEGKDDMLL